MIGGIVFGAAALGAFATGAGVLDWYPTLDKPSWTPPGWLFGPVWTLLYGMMAVAAWLVWRGGETGPIRAPLALFAVQLVLNAAWSILFFGLRSPGAALVDIAALALAISATLAAFRRRSGVAAALLVPYLVWVLFAAALNFEIWRRN